MAQMIFPATWISVYREDTNSHHGSRGDAHTGGFQGYTSFIGYDWEGARTAWYASSTAPRVKLRMNVTDIPGTEGMNYGMHKYEKYVGAVGGIPLYHYAYRSFRPDRGYVEYDVTDNGPGTHPSWISSINGGYHGIVLYAAAGSNYAMAGDVQIIVEGDWNDPPNEVTITEPDGNETYDTGFTATWSYNGDPDGDSLHAEVAYRSGQGGDWSYLTTAVGATSQQFNTPNWAEGDRAQIAVRAIDPDGLKSSFVYSNRFTIEHVPPSFSASSISYHDSNTATMAVTPNDQVIVRNESNVVVNINTPATAANGKTIDHYIISLNGEERTLNSTGSASMGPVDSNTNVTLSVTAVDSAGETTTARQTVSVLPYAPPKLVYSARRLDSFGAETAINLNGSFSSISGYNSILSARYRYKRTDTATWGAWTDFARTTSGELFVATETTETLANTESWDIEFQVADKLNTVTESLVVDTGKPILFIDDVLESIGFNDFPKNPGEFRLNGRLVFAANQFLSSAGGESDAAGVADLNNSDMVGINALFFNDFSQGTEGLFFLKSTSSNGSINPADYNKLNVKDGVIHVDDVPYLESESKTALPLLNGWSNYSSTVESASYWKDNDGIVHLSGMIGGGDYTDQTIIAQLPVGYRPATTEYFIVKIQGSDCVIAPENAYGRIRIIYASTSNWVSLSGVSFKAEG